MQNQCSCSQSGFVPASGWDFSGCEPCQPRTRRRRCADENGCASCSQSPCPAANEECFAPERCKAVKSAACCEQPGSACQQQPCAANEAKERCCQTRNGGSGKGCAGIVSADWQEIGDIFEAGLALRAGTLFPDLHKPLNGYCPCREGAGSCQQAAAFAAWEIRLYLNTHPHDKAALALFQKLSNAAGAENYATSFLPDECRASGWSWVRNPWPWEFDCSCGD